MTVSGSPYQCQRAVSGCGGGNHARPPGWPARARPAGRAQRAGSARAGTEDALPAGRRPAPPQAAHLTRASTSCSASSRMDAQQGSERLLWCVHSGLLGPVLFRDCSANGPNDRPTRTDDHRRVIRLVYSFSLVRRGLLLVSRVRSRWTRWRGGPCARSPRLDGGAPAQQQQRTRPATLGEGMCRDCSRFSLRYGGRWDACARECIGEAGVSESHVGVDRTRSCRHSVVTAADCQRRKFRGDTPTLHPGVQGPGR